MLKLCIFLGMLIFIHEKMFLEDLIGPDYINYFLILGSAYLSPLQPIDYCCTDRERIVNGIIVQIRLYCVYIECSMVHSYNHFVFPDKI